MAFRHEYKHELSCADYHTIRARLQAVMQPDPNTGPDGSYLIRSLYFDSPTDRALREKISGVSQREKFRIRCYNGDYSRISLEKKSKRGGLSEKQAALLSAVETASILNGDTGEAAAQGLLQAATQKCLLKSKSVTDSWVELNLEIRLKDDDTAFLNRLNAVEGVTSAVLVSYNGDYMS